MDRGEERESEELLTSINAEPSIRARSLAVSFGSLKYIFVVYCDLLASHLWSMEARKSPPE